jgi:hypothetical protein
MSWDSVPWFIGGGAQHSPEVARLLAYAATSGAEGIVSPGDLKVQALSVPGASVRVMPGAGLVLNRATGGTSQSYVARNPIEDVVAIAATGSGAGRSDLIVAQIEDPFMPGEPWQDPVDPTVGPYVYTRVISNVPAGTTRLQDVPGYSGRSAITLARVDIPASTGTITGAMIKDLRKLAQPRSVRELRSNAPVPSNLTATTGTQTWPNYVPTIECPAWANYANILVHVSGFVQAGSMADGALYVRLGNTQMGGTVALDFDAVTDGVRHGVTVTGSGLIAAGDRGASALPISLQGVRIAPGTHTGTLRADQSTHVAFDVQFEERVV